MVRSLVAILAVSLAALLSGCGSSSSGASGSNISGAYVRSSGEGRSPEVYCDGDDIATGGGGTALAGGVLIETRPITRSGDLNDGPPVGWIAIGGTDFNVVYVICVPTDGTPPPPNNTSASSQPTTSIPSPPPPTSEPVPSTTGTTGVPTSTPSSGTTITVPTSTPSTVTTITTPTITNPDE